MWTADRVAHRLREAFRTLSRLPNRDLRYLFPKWHSWPEIVRSRKELDYPDEAERMPRIRPEPQAIDEMDEALNWLLYLGDEDRILLAAWACGAPAYWVAKERHISRATFWRQRNRALGLLAVRLNIPST